MTLTSSVDVSGPLTKDPAKRMWENIERLMEEAAREGAEEARRGFMAGAGGRAEVSRIGGRVADRIIGRVVARPSRGGRRWHASGVVQVYNEGMSAADTRSLMAAGSILEGRMNVIRNVTRRIAAKIRKIDLTQGIA